MTVTSPEMKAFRVENYETFSPALPQELADSGRIFVISEEIINGEPRQIARLVSDLETGGLSSDGYRELKNFFQGGAAHPGSAAAFPRRTGC